LEETTTMSSSDADQNANFWQRLTLAVIDVIPKCLWPLVVMMALLLFKGPVYGTIVSASHQISSGASFEIGAAKVTLQKRAIPGAPADVQQALSKMDLDLILFMARNEGGNNTVDTCTPDSLVVLGTLEEYKMMTIIKEKWHDDQGKECDGYHYAYLPLYTETRNYLVKVLNALTFTA
jgi:hypothetical protein